VQHRFVVVVQALQIGGVQPEGLAAHPVGHHQRSRTRQDARSQPRHHDLRHQGTQLSGHLFPQHTDRNQADDLPIGQHRNHRPSGGSQCSDILLDNGAARLSAGDRAHEHLPHLSRVGMGVAQPGRRHDHHEVRAGQCPLMLGEPCQRGRRIIGHQAFPDVIGCGDRGRDADDLLGCGRLDLAACLDIGHRDRECDDQHSDAAENGEHMRGNTARNCEHYEHKDALYGLRITGWVASITP